jgi:biotin synthase-like enzyme
MKHEFIRDIHYYMDGTRVVFTALYHIQRGECCGNKCLHCPFEHQYEKGSTTIQKEFLEESNK